jgi:hypothetical protein
MVYGGMHMKRWITVGLVALLSGCANSPRKLDRELRPYVGLNITAVTAVLGDAESERNTASSRLYTWTVDNRFTMTLPKYTSAIGDIGGNPLTITGQGTENVHLHYKCNLQIATDNAGFIKTFNLNGNEGCQRFVRALDM